jgi:hypothetical protein
VKAAVPPESRYEIKFSASEVHRDRVEQWLHTHPAAFRTAFPPRWVNNIYFDSFDYGAYSENLSGVSDRTKIRYRWYGDLSNAHPGAIELKCKRNLFGWKRVHRLEGDLCLGSRPWREIYAGIRKGSPENLRCFLDAHPLVVLINRYRRKYFISGDGRIRATVDWKQTVWDQRHNPIPNLARPANMPRSMVLEIKCDRSDRELASRIMQTLPIRVGRHSKYMVGVRAISDC